MRGGGEAGLARAGGRGGAAAVGLGWAGPGRRAAAARGQPALRPAAPGARPREPPPAGGTRTRRGPSLFFFIHPTPRVGFAAGCRGPGRCGLDRAGGRLPCSVLLGRSRGGTGAGGASLPGAAAGLAASLPAVALPGSRRGSLPQCRTAGSPPPPRCPPESGTAGDVSAGRSLSRAPRLGARRPPRLDAPHPRCHPRIVPLRILPAASPSRIPALPSPHPAGARHPEPGSPRNPRSRRFPPNPSPSPPRCPLPGMP